MPKLFAQFADMALDDALVHVLIKKAVNGIEDLRLRHTLAGVRDQELENAALTSRQDKRLTGDLRLAAVEIHPWIANHSIVVALRAPPDRADAREDFAHMNRLSHHIVDARRKKFERFIQTLVVAERDDGGL